MAAAEQYEGGAHGQEQTALPSLEAQLCSQPPASSLHWSWAMQMPVVLCPPSCTGGQNRLNPIDLRSGMHVTQRPKNGETPLCFKTQRGMHLPEKRLLRKRVPKS